MASQQGSVFQYMDHTSGSDAFVNNHRYPSRSSSTSSSSSSTLSTDSDCHERSSNAEEHVVESPPTSPASMRRPNAEDSHDDEDTDVDNSSGTNAGLLYQPSVSDAANESEGEDDDAEEEEESDDDEEEDEEDSAPVASDQTRQSPHADRMALERYYSPAYAPPVPYSPGHENEFAVAARPPMAPTTVAPPSQVQYSPTQPPHYQVRPLGPDLSKTTVVGYELLADTLSKHPKDKQMRLGEEAMVPMYRKFENLNHRILLHLQDEISELEEELRYLDECIAQSSPRDHAGHHHPASRRGDARYGGELHYRRTELLGRIYLKLGQYNSALTSFHDVVKSSDPANTEDVQAYRAWIEKRTPIDHNETRFLEHRTDLLTMSERKPASIVGGAAPRQSGAIWLPLVLVLPLMVFAMVPGLLGRLVILSLTGAAIMKLITTTNELMEMMSLQEWTACFSV
ncbi:hypothetical protein N0V90_002646 [Kalmusia sp. IMI 367209]|nr:hypothetical protein N0V90_002646 [Kalmusia sp. IMI 367209]